MKRADLAVGRHHRRHAAHRVSAVGFTPGALASADMALLHAPLPSRPLDSLSMPLAPASAVIAVAGLVGAGLDIAHGAPARLLFALFLALGAGFAAGVVRREQRLAVVVAVPLVYLGLLLVGGVATHDGSLAVWLATAFIVKAPVVLVATAAAAVVAVVRRTNR